MSLNVEIERTVQFEWFFVARSSHYLHQTEKRSDPGMCIFEGLYQNVTGRMDAVYGG
jgi:hypothetical protein